MLGKKAVAALVVFAVSLVLVSTISMNADANAQIPGRGLSFVNLATQLNTPSKIADFMWRNFSYEKDRRQFGKEDYWQSPQELLQNKKGDCEDFASFAHGMLKLNGISSYVMNIYGKRYAHTVCVFKMDGKYHVIDGHDLKSYKSENLKDLISHVYPFWKQFKIAKTPTSPSQNKESVLSQFAKSVQIKRAMGSFA